MVLGDLETVDPFGQVPFPTLTVPSAVDPPARERPPPAAIMMKL